MIEVQSMGRKTLKEKYRVDKKKLQKLHRTPLQIELSKHAAAI